ncbi:MAG: cytochrome d ubiquinol oxidase subunit II [Actinomycetota bacterium]|nr:cytochrome d ubiquinol oxidase subunit II [Actinomycetota bacterium]
MHLYDVPLAFVLVGLVLYVVLGGADFGAGLWQLAAGRGPDAAQLREHAHDSMGPVWEANHVWLIFVLTVLWTAYPVAFGSIASTLTVPLFVAAVGIIFRGTAYALRSGARRDRETTVIDSVTGVSSILTPFSLGTVVGAIASRRVPVGNAAGASISSWLNPTSVMIGLLAVGVSAYLAAVFMAADAQLGQDTGLERRLHVRALISGVVTGGLGVAGLVVLSSDARPLFDSLTSGAPLVVVIISGLAGVGTLVLLARRQYGACRYTAAVAVAAVVAAWALAQSPVLLSGLTVAQAAAPRDVLVTVTVAIVAGAVILFPSLGLLFGLLLGGRLGGGDATGARVRGTGPARPGRGAAPKLLWRLAGAALLAGFGLLNLADAPWAHGIGVSCLLAFVVLAFAALVPGATAWATRGDE